MDGFTEVTVWVLVDESGNFVAHHDADKLQGAYEEDIGEFTLTDGTAYRTLKLTVKVPTPRPVELSATVAAEPAAGELVAA